MKEKMSMFNMISFVLLIISALIFFTYTNEVVFESIGRYGLTGSYTTVGLIVNTIIIMVSIAIIELSVMWIRKIPKDKDDYNKALIIANIMIGTVLNMFIIFWPIAQNLLQCR